MLAMPLLDAGLSTIVAAAPDLGHTTLAYPGVYDNVLAQPGSPVYDSSPHVWTYAQPCDITPDAPYSSYADAGGGTSKLSFIGSVGVGGGQGNSDCIYGSCDDHDTYGIAGSQWQGPGNGEAPGDLWNPAVASHTGMAPTQQLAIPLTAAQVDVRTHPAVNEEKEGAGAGSQCRGATAKSSPAHMMMMGHALIFGALSATKEVADQAVKGDFSVSWERRFRATSMEACEAVTSVGGYVLKTHILKD